jgi:hypothetical protein
MWFVDGLLPWRPGFDPKPVHVGFVVDKVTVGQVFLQYSVNVITPRLHIH